MKKAITKNSPNDATFYSVEFKRKIVEEYLASDFTKRELQDKYGIKANSAIHEWIHKFDISYYLKS